MEVVMIDLKGLSKDRSKKVQSVRGLAQDQLEWTNINHVDDSNTVETRLWW